MTGGRVDIDTDDDVVVVVASKSALDEAEAEADWPRNKGVLVIGCGDVRKNGISTSGSGRRGLLWRMNVVCKMYLIYQMYFNVYRKKVDVHSAWKVTNKFVKMNCVAWM